MEMPKESAGLLMRLDAADARALAWVAERRSRRLVAAMRAITHTGDAPVVIAALTAVLLAWPGSATAQVAGATTLGLALFSLAKRLANRPRPTHVQAVLAAPDRFSMPSGHATAAFAIAVSAASLSPTLGAILVPWAFAVGTSRVVMGVHYPLDVLAGAVCGTLSAAAVAGALA